MPIIILRLRKLWAALTNATYRRALRFGVAAAIEHENAVGHLKFDVIVDVGANRGQFSLFARHRFPECRIIAFEPLREPSAAFKKIFQGDFRTRLVEMALGTDRGTVLMYVASKDDSSSLLRPTEMQRQSFGTVPDTEQTVLCGPLPDFVEQRELDGCCLLKLDTQGTELQVLSGAEKILHQFAAIYCEVSFVELYTGQALASEIIRFLEARNFVVSGVFNVRSAPDGRQIQADMLFLPRSRQSEDASAGSGA